jgi:hypothetical protein
MGTARIDLLLKLEELPLLGDNTNYSSFEEEPLASNSNDQKRNYWACSRNEVTLASR